MKKLLILMVLVMLGGCTTIGAIDNAPLKDQDPTKAYSFENSVMRLNNGEYTIVIAMSGGGTRAAALSYGVLKALKAEMHPHNPQADLLDEVDVISAVSGGSFTAAYYGLYGDQIFSDFEQDFLYYDVSGTLVSNLFNPLLWFSSQGRTEEASK